MWTYERRLQYPVKITRCNPKIAQVIISQYGGPDGEMSASMRYLSQRYSMTDKSVAGLLTDIGTEAPQMFLSIFFTCSICPFCRTVFQIHINTVIIIYYNSV